MRLPNPLSSALIALGLFACDAAQNPPAPDAPAVLTAPLEGDLFTLQGDLRFASCSTGSPYYRRVAVASDFRARALQTPTCDGLTGADLTACQAFVWPSGVALVAAPTLVSGTSAAGDESYTLQAQRVFTDSADVEHPITWRLTNSDTLTRGPRFNLGTSSNAPRLFFWGNVLKEVTAPATTGGVVQQHYVADQMASMRINVEYTPTQNIASDRIATVSVNVNALGSDSASVNRYVVRFTDGAFVADTVAPGDPDYPRTQDDALETPAVFGVSPQRLRLELPVPPAVGADADLTYSLSVNVQFGDGVRLSQTFPFQPAGGATTVAPCAVLAQTLTIVRPNTRVSGTIFLRPDATYPGGQSPYPVAYAPEIRNTDTEVLQPSTVTGDFVTAAWATPNVPFPFSWSGVEVGDYRVDNVDANISGRSVPRWHVALTYPGRNELLAYPDNNGTYRPMLRFPMKGASSPASSEGLFAVNLGAPVTLRIGSSNDPLSTDGDMAFVEGTLDLVGCEDGMARLHAGVAEMRGTADRGVGSASGWARGLFMQGTSGFQVAAIYGGWVENVYRLQLKEAGQYDGILTIEPAAKQTWTLTPGYANRTLATPRQYQTSKVVVAFALTGGTPFRNARLEIHRDLGSSTLGSFYDPGTSTLLGKYHALSIAPDNAVHTSYSLPIIGLATTGAVSIQASAEVETPPGSGLWARTSFPPFATAMDSCGVCMTLDGTTYTDDAVGPVLSSLTPSQTVPTATTTFTLTGTLTDQVPITAVLIDGVEYPVTSTSNGATPPTFTASFSVDVALPVEGANTFTISAKGLCGNLTAAQTVVITRTADLCAMPIYDQCTESQLGSVFGVEVVRESDGAVCSIQCQTASPGAPITCDPTPVCP